MYYDNYIENIIKNIIDAIIISDDDGNIKFFNDELLNLFGFSKEKLNSKKVYDIFEGFYSFRDLLNKKENIEREEVLINADKNKIHFMVSIYKLDNKDFLFKFEDIKKKRKLNKKIKENKAIYTFDKIIGNNKRFKCQIEFAKKISDSKSTILITGETGTGKEVFAQSIHNMSDRKNKPFIAINSAAIPDNLIESELFGYVEGAFTGAKKTGQIGKFKSADKGTIFLDEIGEMPFNLQTRLLRVIEEGIVTRIGSIDQEYVDVRIIAASNKDLKKEVEKGNFRKDLFYRLNVLPLSILPLRERKDDIPILIDYFMDKISRRLNKKKVKITKFQMDYLINYNWPGNIRELENFVELIINLEYIPNKYFENKIEKTKKDFIIEKNMTLEELEKNYITDMLRKNDRNITKVAKILGIGRNTLHRKINKYEL
ncbi:sigma-54 interaction domain-containing protein [Senegalia massiliensis]|uniref:sigma-54 interaction domain-containing protein n=1 Tax=Senegalia massiliensis TaxID=1720316 RepID=UPI001F5ECB7F|nr:sigma 54-interacting transcriptional regulator [Senegalia massiliensis]